MKKKSKPQEAHAQVETKLYRVEGFTFNQPLKYFYETFDLTLNQLVQVVLWSALLPK